MDIKVCPDQFPVLLGLIYPFSHSLVVTLSARCQHASCPRHVQNRRDESDADGGHDSAGAVGTDGGQCAEVGGARAVPGQVNQRGVACV